MFLCLFLLLSLGFCFSFGFGVVFRDRSWLCLGSLLVLCLGITPGSVL